MAQLKVDGLTVALAGAPAVAGVTFTLAPGERLGLIGAAGAGRSLVALAVLGLLPAAAKVTGAISLDDVPLPSADRERAGLRRKRMGAILRSSGGGFDPLRPIGPQIGDALRQAGGSGDIDALVAATLADVGLSPALATRYPDELTAAQNQLAMVATALVAKPELLVADEPSAGLDLVGRRRVVELIARHCAERNMGLLLISRDLKEVAMLCTRIVVMQSGVALESGDTQEIFGHPRQAYTRAMMSAGRHRPKTLMRTPIGGVVLDIRHVSRRYGGDRTPFRRGAAKVVLNDLSLSVRNGESLALVGSSGAGRSTLLRIIAGLERATGGELEFERQVYHGSDLPPRLRRNVTLVTGEPGRSFNPRLTVGESIAEPLRLETLRPIEELSARIIEAVTAVGFAADALGRYPSDFSAGEQQRLAIARALMTRPRLILLDEPVEMLDVVERGAILTLLNRLRADFGMTLMIAVQDLEVVRVIADRVAIMHEGKVIEVATPAQLRENPQQPLTQRLLEAALPDVGIVPIF